MKPDEIPAFNWGEGLTASQTIKLDIRAKKRILNYWECKKRVAQMYMKQNKKKIKDLEKILEDLK